MLTKYSSITLIIQIYFYEIIEKTKSAIGDLDAKHEYNEVLVENHETSEKVKFRGSPTLLINGEDFEDMSEPENPAMMWRYYKNGLPEIELIKSKLKQMIMGE